MPSQTHQITCTTKTDRSDHETITRLGGPDGTWTKAQVVTAIESRQHAFYTEVGGKRAWLRVRQGRHGKYVQTYADETPTNNLLQLRDC